MVVVHATFPVDPEKREEALDLIGDLAEQSRSEDGVVDYRAGADVEDPNTVRFLKRDEDEAAFGAHAETGHFQAFEEALPDLLAGEPQVTRFDVSDVSDVDL